MTPDERIDSLHVELDLIRAVIERLVSAFESFSAEAQANHQLLVLISQQLQPDPEGPQRFFGEVPQ